MANAHAIYVHYGERKCFNILLIKLLIQIQNIMNIFNLDVPSKDL